MQSKKYIIANWKALPETWGQAEQLLDFLSANITQNEDVAIVICPPFNYLEQVSKILKATSLGNFIELGAQNIENEMSGGELIRLGVRYVINGHSDRRYKLEESDEMINRKIKLVLENELTPIVCVGERERSENSPASSEPVSGWKEVLRDQVKKTFAGLSHDQLEKCFLAYEPVWAISTNSGARPDTPESALGSVAIIKDVLIENWKLKTLNSPKVLYGGSVTPDNVSDFISQKEIDGVLVGGASVRKEDFVKILKLAV